MNKGYQVENLTKLLKKIHQNEIQAKVRKDNEGGTIRNSRKMNRINEMGRKEILHICKEINNKTKKHVIDFDKNKRSLSTPNTFRSLTSYTSYHNISLNCTPEEKSSKKIEGIYGEENEIKGKVCSNDKNNFWAKSININPNYSLTPKMREIMNYKPMRSIKFAHSKIFENEINSKIDKNKTGSIISIKKLELDCFNLPINKQNKYGEYFSQIEKKMLTEPCFKNQCKEDSEYNDNFMNKDRKAIGESQFCSNNSELVRKKPFDKSKLSIETSEVNYNINVLSPRINKTSIFSSVERNRENGQAKFIKEFQEHNIQKSRIAHKVKAQQKAELEGSYEEISNHAEKRIFGTVANQEKASPTFFNDSTFSRNSLENKNKNEIRTPVRSRTTERCVTSKNKRNVVSQNNKYLLAEEKEIKIEGWESEIGNYNLKKHGEAEEWCLEIVEY